MNKTMIKKGAIFMIMGTTRISPFRKAMSNGLIIQIKSKLPGGAVIAELNGKLIIIAKEDSYTVTVEDQNNDKSNLKEKENGKCKSC